MLNRAVPKIELLMKPGRAWRPTIEKCFNLSITMPLFRMKVDTGFDDEEGVDEDDDGDDDEGAD